MRLGVAGIRRSGNHSTFTWLLYHFNSMVFYNNHPFPGEGRGNREFYVRHGDLMIEAARKADYVDNKLLTPDGEIYGMENYEIDQIIRKHFEKDFDKVIIILRDPINNLASLMRYKGRLLHLREFSGLWKSYATEVMRGGIDFMMALIYDRWFTHADYRRDIEIKLGLPVNDYGMSKVHHMGHGSSFDKMRFQNNAQQMEVLSRWRQCLDDQLFLRILKDEELLSIRQQIFGPLPEELERAIDGVERITPHEIDEIERSKEEKQDNKRRDHRKHKGRGRGKIIAHRNGEDEIIED